MTISVVFDPPLRSDSPAVFNSKAFTLVGNLNTFSTQANSTASDINAQVTAPGVVAIGNDLTGANTIGNVSGISANVTTVAGISANVTTVAGISSNVTTVANNTANINAAVADLPALAAKVSKTGDTMSGNLNVPSINGGQLAGMRNKAINGKMEIAQRGTSFSAIATGTYSLDRWIYGKAGDVVSTISRETDVPSNNEFQSSLRITVTTADTSIAAGDFQNLSQRIEGYNARDLIGRTFTLSFWVRSAKTGIHCVAFRNGGSDRSYVAEYTISAANTWEFKTVTVSGGLITSGTWNWTNGSGLVVDFPSAAGSSFQTTPNAWNTGNFIATANQVNCLDTVGNIFAITGVQLEQGSVATPFEHRIFGAEFALCQRYYCETRGHLTAYVSAAGQDPRAPVYWPVQMRVAPTTTNAGGSVANASSADLGDITVTGAAFRVVAAGAGLTSVVGRVITASAEL